MFQRSPGTSSQLHYLWALKAQHPDLSTAIELAQGKAFLVRQRLPEQLDPWLKQAIESGLEPFRRFARALAGRL
jgi:transposase